MSRASLGPTPGSDWNKASGDASPRKRSSCESRLVRAIGRADVGVDAKRVRFLMPQDFGAVAEYLCRFRIESFLEHTKTLAAFAAARTHANTTFNKKIFGQSTS
jgi:hypothetical protein